MAKHPITLFGIRNCDSCRNARKWLDQHDLDHVFHDLRDDGLQIQMLERWSDRVDWLRLLNTRSRTWRELPKATRTNMSRDKAFATMLQHPTLVKRPVLESKDFILLGFTPSHYAQILEKA
jgi:Spx/MgsR family transcriptional regulator